MAAGGCVDSRRVSSAYRLLSQEACPVFLTEQNPLPPAILTALLCPMSFPVLSCAMLFVTITCLTICLPGYCCLQILNFTLFSLQNTVSQRVFFFFFFFCFGRRGQQGLMKPRMASNFPGSFGWPWTPDPLASTPWELRFQTCVGHHIRFMQYWGSTLGLWVC